MTASIYACGFSFLFHIKDLMALNGFLKNYQSWVETEAKSLLFISFACLCCNLKLWKNDFYPSMSTILPNHGTCFKCNALKCLIFKSHSGLWERTRYMAVLFWGSVLAGKSRNTHTQCGGEVCLIMWCYLVILRASMKLGESLLLLRIGE